MMIKEKLIKEGNQIPDRLNELGLTINKFTLLDWNPMFALLFYDDKDVKPHAQPQPQSAKAEKLASRQGIEIVESN